MANSDFEMKRETGVGCCQRTNVVLDFIKLSEEDMALPFPVF
jgi:hypothetical protein